MMFKANGLSASLAAGLILGMAGSSLAAGTVNPAASVSSINMQTSNTTQARVPPNRHRSRHLKSAAHAKAGKVAMKPAVSTKAPANDQVLYPTDIPPSVANANAELTPTLPVPSAPSLVSPPASPADGMAQTNTQVLSPDQLNDIDRAAQAAPLSASPMAMASANSGAMSMAAGNDESSKPDRTSLIGKIFIGFGLLLTLASAARMLVA